MRKPKESKKLEARVFYSRDKDDLFGWSASLFWKLNLKACTGQMASARLESSARYGTLKEARKASCRILKALKVKVFDTLP